LLGRRQAEAGRAELLLGGVPDAVALVEGAEPAVADEVEEAGVEFVPQPLVAQAQVQDVEAAADRGVHEVQARVAVPVEEGRGQVLDCSVQPPVLDLQHGVGRTLVAADHHALAQPVPDVGLGRGAGEYADDFPPGSLGFEVVPGVDRGVVAPGDELQLVDVVRDRGDLGAQVGLGQLVAVGNDVDVADA
jgi:hypothetical protein